MLFNDTNLSFVGRWGYHLDPLIPNEFHSFHATNHSGDFASLNFTGTAVDVFGIGGPRNGQYNVTLDGQTSTHDGQVAAQQVLLYSQQGLDPTRVHSLVLTNIQEGNLFTLDLINVTSPSATPSSAAPPLSTSSSSVITPPPAAIPIANDRIAKGTEIAITLVGLLIGIPVILVISFLAWRRLRNQPGRRNNTATEFRGGAQYPMKHTMSNIPKGMASSEGVKSPQDLGTPRPTFPAAPIPFALQRADGSDITRFPQGPSIADTPRPRDREPRSSIRSLSGPSLRSSSNSIFFGQNIGNRTTRGNASPRYQRLTSVGSRVGSLSLGRDPSTGLMSL